jgi:hypothetical protein
MDARRSYLILLSIMAVVSLVYLLNTMGRCETDYDCRTGELCDDDGTCKIDYSCEADTDCPESMHCSKSKKLCVDDKICTTNSDCNGVSYCSGYSTCRTCATVLTTPTLVGDIEVIENLKLCIGDLSHPSTSIRLFGKFKATSAAATPVLLFTAGSNVPTISRFAYTTTDGHTVHIERPPGTSTITVDLYGVPYLQTIVL